MKKSTIMITAAVLIILGSLTAFNVKIKQIYLTGSYKSRFKGMDFTPVNGLENIDIHSANRLGIVVEYGDKEGVWIRENKKETFLLDFRNKTLTLDISKEAKEEGFNTWGDVIIITKTLNKITASPYLMDKESLTDITGNVEVKGFMLSNLDLQIGLGISASLYKMQLDKLTAFVGDKKNGNAGLYIGSDTKINTANLNVPGKSTLTLADPKITKAVYNLSDSATVSLNGKLVQLIK